MQAVAWYNNYYYYYFGYKVWTAQKGKQQTNSSSETWTEVPKIYSFLDYKHACKLRLDKNKVQQQKTLPMPTNLPRFFIKIIFILRLLVYFTSHFVE